MPSEFRRTPEDFGNVMVINFTRDTFFSYFIRLDDVERINGIERKMGIRRMLERPGNNYKKTLGVTWKQATSPLHPTTRSNKGCPRQNDHKSVAFVMYSLITRIICWKIMLISKNCIR